MSEKSDRVVQPGAKGRITLRLETVGYSGATTEAALIQWVDSSVPVTRAEMKMDVQPVLEVTPKRMVRFRSIAGTPMTQKVTIRSADCTPFTVSEVETSSAVVSAVIEGEGSEYGLSITLSAEAPAGMLKETVVVHTDLPTVPRLEIKVTGVVKAAP
jgi:hypothetical protein